MGMDFRAVILFGWDSSGWGVRDNEEAQEKYREAFEDSIWLDRQGKYACEQIFDCCETKAYTHFGILYHQTDDFHVLNTITLLQMEGIQEDYEAELIRRAVEIFDVDESEIGRPQWLVFPQIY